MSEREPANVPASIRQRLLNRARESGASNEDLLARYGIERFLYRLGQSPYRERLVIKGAILFQVWDPAVARMTRDVDMLGSGDMSPETVEQALRQIAGQPVELDDGVVFDPDSVRSSRIPTTGPYPGVHASVDADLAGARITVRLDVGVGDAVDPAPEEIEYPVLLDLPAPRVRAYPREVVVAEKVHAMVTRGMVNSRLKDYYDVWVLARRFPFDGAALQRGVRTTFMTRGTPLPSGSLPALTQEYSLAPERRLAWSAFARRARLPADSVPSLDTVVHEVASFVTPLFGDGALGRWPPGGPWQGVSDA